MPVNPTPEAAILYDEECGLCRWSLAMILAWDRRANLRPVPIQSPAGGLLLAGLDEEERLRSWHLVTADGGRHSAGAAAGPLLRLLPAGRPLARLAEALPGLSDRGYRLVADHRGALGRLIPAAAKRRADRRISRRAGARAGR